MVDLVGAVSMFDMFWNLFRFVYDCISEIVKLPICRWFKRNYCSDYVKVIGREVSSLPLLVAANE
jgi:hypothetical protein